MKKIALLSLLTSSLLVAGGYKIPENSLNGVALSAANIAHANRADSAYYNPANMVFLEDKSALEIDATDIYLSKVDFAGHSAIQKTDTKYRSRSENFVVPSAFYVSPMIAERFRVGVSVVVPGGLSKRWEQKSGKYYSQEYTLQIVEFNPTIAVKIMDNLSFALGARVVQTSGVIKGSGDDLATNTLQNGVDRSMTGDSIDYGYNLALTYKPLKELELAATYRSKIDLTVEGDAALSILALGLNSVTKADVSVPLPATLSLAAAYTFTSDTTLEAVYERVSWSAYKELDFNFDDAASEASPFGAVVAKKWQDSSAYRLGITQKLDALTLMGGVVYDETPIPDETLNFETPDSNALSVSYGIRYEVNDNVSVGFSGLYSMRESRKLSDNVNEAGIVGEFTNSNVYIVSTGIEYKF